MTHPKSSLCSPSLLLPLSIFLSFSFLSSLSSSFPSLSVFSILSVLLLLIFPDLLLSYSFLSSSVSLCTPPLVFLQRFKQVPVFVRSPREVLFTSPTVCLHCLSSGISQHQEHGLQASVCQRLLPLPVSPAAAGFPVSTPRLGALSLVDTNTSDLVSAIDPHKCP